MPCSFKTCEIAGLLIVEPRLFKDSRGSFMETFKSSEFAAVGIAAPFVQDNLSFSSRGTLRGLHFQREPYAQGKLMRVSRGRIWDVAVDLRPGSESFGRYFSIELSAENRLEFWIPAGFAHGFLALEDGTELQYKCTNEYNPASEGGIRWNDPELAIAWPIEEVLVSEKDALLPSFADFKRGGA